MLFVCLIWSELINILANFQHAFWPIVDLFLQKVLVLKLTCKLKEFINELGLRYENIQYVIVIAYYIRIKRINKKLYLICGTSRFIVNINESFYNNNTTNKKP